MKRTLMQAYVHDSAAAVELYQRAFDAALGFNVKNETGMYYHAELNVYGQIVAVAEADGTARVTGNTMQFCLHFGEGGEDKVRKAYDVLKAGCQLGFPLGPCDFSPLAVDLTDRFGIRWCLFV